MAVRPIDGTWSKFVWNLGEKSESLARKFRDGKACLIDLRLAVEAQPTITPQSEWVSVENALPPEHEPVLCIVSGKPKANITLEEAYQLGSWNKADGWIIDEYLDWEDADVSWWMSLPAPPNYRPPEGEEGLK